MEPKKSARLAEKRKLREEGGTPYPEDDYYFTPLTRVSRNTAGSGRQSSVSPNPLRGRVSPSLRRPKAISAVSIPITTSNTNYSGTTLQTKETNKSSSPVNLSDTLLSKLTTAQDSKQKGILPDRTQSLHLEIPEQAIRGNEGEFKSEKAETKSVVTRIRVPSILFISRLDLTTVSFPEGMDLPFSRGTPPKQIVLTKCSVPGCENMKKYTCSKTNRPLCSLKCYKQNLDVV